MPQSARNKTRRTRLSGPQRREQILNIAWDICRNEGFPAITMERLASDAGITRTVIYQQFGDLEAMLLTLIKRQFDKGIQVFLAAAQGANTADNPFYAIFSQLLTAVDSDPDNWSLLLHTPAGAPAALYEQLNEGRIMTRAVLARSLASVHSTHTVDAELSTHLMQVVAEELLRLRLAEPEKYSHERLLAQVHNMTNVL